MDFSFRLVDVKCNAVKSSAASPWGAKDGIRIYFLVFSGNGDYNLAISGREYPEPDIADNLSFIPGKTMLLHDFPSTTTPSWSLRVNDVSETDFVWVAIIGINEGLPYMGGGGGGSASKIGFEAIQKFTEWLAAGPLDNPATEQALSFGFGQLNHAIAGINSAPECRGLAFAYELAFQARYLFAQHFKKKTQTLLVNPQNAAQGLAIANEANPSPGCGVPNYEARLEVVRETVPMVEMVDTPGDGVKGPIQDFNQTFKRCENTQRIIYAWPILYDRTLTFTPSFFFAVIPLIWKIDATEIYDPQGTLKVTTEAHFPVSDTKIVKPVTIDYTVSSVGGKNKLTLKTYGAEGNYSVKISLLLKFWGNQPPMVFYEDDVLIEGQQVDGGDDYQAYLNCVLDYVRTGYKIHARQWVSPGTPRDQKLEFERNVLAMGRMLGGEIRTRDDS